MTNFTSRGKFAVAASAALVLAGCSSGPSAEDYFSIPAEQIPEGVELTVGGTELGFGESATVAVDSSHGGEVDRGTMTYWNVTVEELRTISLDEVEGNLGEPVEVDGELPEEFVCVDYSFELVGSDADMSDPEVYVTDPQISPVAAEGQRANSTSFFDDNVSCGISEGELRGYDNPQPGSVYRGAYLSFNSPEGDEQGADPVGGTFSYDDGLVEPADDRDLDITWR